MSTWFCKSCADSKTIELRALCKHSTRDRTAPTSSYRIPRRVYWAKRAGVLKEKSFFCKVFCFFFILVKAISLWTQLFPKKQNQVNCFTKQHKSVEKYVIFLIFVSFITRERVFWFFWKTPTYTVELSQNFINFQKKNKNVDFLFFSKSC